MNKYLDKKLEYILILVILLFIIYFAKCNYSINMKYHNMQNNNKLNNYENFTVNELLDNEDMNELKNALKSQVDKDPNILEVEKSVINDIYDTYFNSSNELEILKRINESASEKNPISNKQEIKNILNLYS